MQYSDKDLWSTSIQRCGHYSVRVDAISAVRNSAYFCNILDNVFHVVLHCFNKDNLYVRLSLIWAKLDFTVPAVPAVMANSQRVNESMVSYRLQKVTDIFKVQRKLTNRRRNKLHWELYKVTSLTFVSQLAPLRSQWLNFARSNRKAVNRCEHEITLVETPTYRHVRCTYITNAIASMARNDIGQPPLGAVRWLAVTDDQGKW